MITRTRYAYNVPCPHEPGSWNILFCMHRVCLYFHSENASIYTRVSMIIML